MIDDESKILYLLQNLGIHEERISFLHSGATGGGRKREQSYFTTCGFVAGKKRSRSLVLHLCMSRDRNRRGRQKNILYPYKQE